MTTIQMHSDIGLFKLRPTLPWIATVSSKIWTFSLGLFIFFLKLPVDQKLKEWKIFYHSLPFHLSLWDLFCNSKLNHYVRLNVFNTNFSNRFFDFLVYFIIGSCIINGFLIVNLIVGNHKWVANFFSKNSPRIEFQTFFV